MEVPANWLSPELHPTASLTGLLGHTPSPVQWTFTFLIKNPWGYLMNYSQKTHKYKLCTSFQRAMDTPSPHTIPRHMPMTFRVLLLGSIPIIWTSVGNTGSIQEKREDM